jgi:hypothetical protein
MKTAAVVIIAVLFLAIACNTTPKAVVQVTPGGYLGSLGSSGCSTAATFTPWHGEQPETGLDSKRGSFWALFFTPVPPPVRQDVKVAWKMTGTGPWTFAVSDSSGASVNLDWGPEGHSGSNWEHPGDEVGTGFTFTHAGCWNVHVARTDVSGDLWLEVGS